MKKTTQQPQGMPKTLSGDELSALTGLTDRRHRQLATAGHFPQPVKGQYDANATLTGLFRYFIGSRDARSKELQQARIDRAQSQARIAKVDADLSEKRTMPAEWVKRQWFSSVMNSKMRLYRSGNQIAVEVSMRCGLSDEQNIVLSAVVNRHHAEVIRDQYVGDACAVVCPNCQQLIKPPGHYEKISNLPMMYRDKKRFEICIEHLTKDSAHITEAIQQKQKLMTLNNQTGTWNQPQAIEQTKNEK